MLVWVVNLEIYLMKKRWLYYVSPFTILAAVVLIMMLVGIIEALIKNGLKGMGGIVMMGLFVILIVSLGTTAM